MTRDSCPGLLTPVILKVFERHAPFQLGHCQPPASGPSLADMIVESVLLLLSRAEGTHSPGSQIAGTFRGAGFEIDFQKDLCGAMRPSPHLQVRIHYR